MKVPYKIGKMQRKESTAACCHYYCVNLCDLIYKQTAARYKRLRCCLDSYMEEPRLTNHVLFETKIHNKNQTIKKKLCFIPFESTHLYQQR